MGHVQCLDQDSLYLQICGDMVQEWSHVRGIVRTCEKTPRKKRQESCDLSFFET